MLQTIQSTQPSLQVKRAYKSALQENTRVLPLVLSGVELLRPSAPPPTSKRIAVKTNDAIHLINVEEIMHCLADNNYCTIYYGKGLKVMVAKTLKSVGEVLPTSLFMRVHNSHIVRLDTIHLVYTDHIVLNNGDVIPLSRTNKKDLISQLANTTTSL